MNTLLPKKAIKIGIIPLKLELYQSIADIKYQQKCNYNSKKRSLNYW